MKGISATASIKRPTVKRQFLSTNILNRGQEDRFYAKGTHPGIIDKDVFDTVQTLIEKRKDDLLQSNNTKYLSAYKPHSVF